MSHRVTRECAKSVSMTVLRYPSDDKSEKPPYESYGVSIFQYLFICNGKAAIVVHRRREQAIVGIRWLKDEIQIVCKKLWLDY